MTKVKKTPTLEDAIYLIRCLEEELENTHDRLIKLEQEVTDLTYKLNDMQYHL